MTSFSTVIDEGLAAAIEPEGKIVAAGRAPNGSGGYVFAVARYNPLDGGLDSTFGTGGKTTVTFPGTNHQTFDTEARAVACNPTAKFSWADGSVVAEAWPASTAMAPSTARLKMVENSRTP